MDIMNWVCRNFLDYFVIVFVDDILIYSKSKDDHMCHLRIVLQFQKEYKFFAKLSVSFGLDRFPFLHALCRVWVYRLV